MADKDKLKLSSCPICGYTDSGTDAAAMDEDIRMHVKTVHNLDPESLGGSSNVKLQTEDATGNSDTPAIAPAVNVGTATANAIGFQGAVNKKNDSELINNN
jgi:hypothetical protein